MNQEAAAQAAPVKRKKPAPTGEFVTKIYVYYDDQGEKGMCDFANKADLDDWLSKTNVSIVKIIRGREKKIRKAVVFV